MALRVRNARPSLALHFLDVGQADNILIQVSTGVNVLIDGGNNADSPGIVSYLKTQEVRRLNAVITTHPREEYIGGLDTVIEEFPVDQIYIPKAVTTTKTFEDFLTAVSGSEAKVIQAKAGVVLEVQTGAVSTTSQVRIVSVDLAGETVTIKNEGDFPLDI